MRVVVWYVYEYARVWSVPQSVLKQAELLETNAGSEAGARGPLAPDLYRSGCLP